MSEHCDQFYLVTGTLKTDKINTPIAETRPSFLFRVDSNEIWSNRADRPTRPTTHERSTVRNLKMKNDDVIGLKNNFHRVHLKHI